MNRLNDNNEKEKSIEDRAYEHYVHKMKSKMYPNIMPKHVSELRNKTDYTETMTGSAPLQVNTESRWKYSI